MDLTKLPERAEVLTAVERAQAEETALIKHVDQCEQCQVAVMLRLWDTACAHGDDLTTKVHQAAHAAHDALAMYLPHGSRVTYTGTNPFANADRYTVVQAMSDAPTPALHLHSDEPTSLQCWHGVPFADVQPEDEDPAAHAHISAVRLAAIGVDNALTACDADARVDVVRTRDGVIAVRVDVTSMPEIPALAQYARALVSLITALNGHPTPATASRVFDQAYDIYRRTQEAKEDHARRTG